ncbi:MAG TPA: 4a-hydroxytetrahydrobiopterin dehydratase [Ignavibacteriaceae bacterium]|nr:4a-hydroxytetrahydrobiopterin dehydratase [Ignavibacteriaceae bacterium]
MARLNEDQVNQNLETINGWNLIDNKISKEYELKDFKSALAFVNKVGEKAEGMDHHPDILLHSWNKVKISVSTHSEGGITEKDFNLAKEIEGINI